MKKSIINSSKCSNQQSEKSDLKDSKKVCLEIKISKSKGSPEITNNFHMNGAFQDNHIKILPVDELNRHRSEAKSIKKF